MIRLRKQYNAEVAVEALKNIFEQLYIDENGNYDPNKEWDSAADYLEYIAMRVNDVMVWDRSKKA
jgi:hypothetical protein